MPAPDRCTAVPAAHRGPQAAVGGAVQNGVDLLRALPLIVLLETIWAIGECAGYVFGLPRPHPV